MILQNTKNTAPWHVTCQQLLPECCCHSHNLSASDHVVLGAVIWTLRQSASEYVQTLTVSNHAAWTREILPGPVRGNKCDSENWVSFGAQKLWIWRLKFADSGIVIMRFANPIGWMIREPGFSELPIWIQELYFVDPVWYCIREPMDTRKNLIVFSFLNYSCTWLSG